MGRPPLKVKQVPIRLEVKVLARLKELLPPNGLAKFVREAVSEKLAREEKQLELESKKRSINTEED